MSLSLRGSSLYWNAIDSMNPKNLAKIFKLRMELFKPSSLRKVPAAALDEYETGEMKE